MRLPTLNSSKNTIHSKTKSSCCSSSSGFPLGGSVVSTWLWLVFLGTDSASFAANNVLPIQEGEEDEEEEDWGDDDDISSASAGPSLESLKGGV